MTFVGHLLTYSESKF